MNDLRAYLIDLKAQRATAIGAAKELVLAGKLDTEEYKAANGKIDELTRQVDEVEALVAKDEGGKPAPDGQVRAGMAAASTGEASGHAKAVKALADAARRGFAVEKAQGDMLQEAEDADGGYTVPEDIVNDVIQLREARESLLDLVSVERVTTKSGRRTIKKRGQHTGFATVAEAAKMGKVATPQFTTITFDIEKRRGYLPVTTELYEDSDANIARIVTEWLGDEARVTANKEILAQVATKEAVDLKDLDGIIAAWVGLGSAFRASSALVTNDNGLLWLATLKDANGRYLLTPNPAQPQRLQLAVGPYVIPVRIYDNTTMPNTDETKIPMTIGDLKAGVRYFDRRSFSLKVNDSGVVGDLNALEQDLILWVGSMRDDCVVMDDAAFVNGYITASTDP